MGKVSPVTTKYIIHSNIQIEGLVEKPDVIGAIFGQTEGFLGQDLELRELQRSGKVGRIEVKIDNVNSKSTGQIIIPCSLDKAETAIIAAALETIERIGPCNAKVRVDKIEDVRVSKRDFVIARAKELLRTLQANVLPDSQELTEEVAHAVRMMEISEWGRERLAAGPAINESEEIIIVEGRADVLNLLKNGFKNAVAINGTNVPESIKELCRQKTVTAFVDGDRGGDMILKELLESTEIDYITKAPPGKEVEELAKKEIHIALRARIAAEQFKFEITSPRRPQISTQNFRRETIREPRMHQNNTIEIAAEAKENFKEMLNELIGTRGAYILDKDYNILGKVPTSELETTLRGIKNAFAVVFDGSITKEIIKVAEDNEVNFLIATNTKIKNSETSISIITAEELAS